MTEGTCEARRSQVREQLDGISQELSRAGALRDSLAENLLSVTRESVPGVPGQKDPTISEGELVPLAGELQNILRSLRDLNDCYQDLNNRLEL